MAQGKEKEVKCAFCAGERFEDGNCVFCGNALPSRDGIISRLEALTGYGRGCLCGHGEWCENCDSGSAINHVRKEIRAIVVDLKREWKA